MVERRDVASQTDSNSEITPRKLDVVKYIREFEEFLEKEYQKFKSEETQNESKRSKE